MKKKFNKRVFEGIHTWPVIKSYIVKMLAMTPAAAFLGALICFMISLRSNLSPDWARFWKVAPYVAMAALLVNMLRIKGDKEKSLSVFLILTSTLVLIPIDIYFSGVKKVLKYAGYGFAAGVIAMGLVFSVFTLHYRKTERGYFFEKLTDNFNKENFLNGLILSIFLAFVTVLGHAIVVLYGLF